MNNAYEITCVSPNFPTHKHCRVGNLGNVLYTSGLCRSMEILFLHEPGRCLKTKKKRLGSADVDHMTMFPEGI